MTRNALRSLGIATLLASCSALIDPDPGRLGGGDGSVGQLDGGPRADGATCPSSCDDDVACTTDSCEGARCTHTPNDAACGDGERCNPVLGCVPFECTRDEECSDGRFCNGEERCDPATSSDATGCVAGAPPSCTDGATCTNDRCDEARDECVFEPDHGACSDAFPCTSDTCDPAATDDPSGCAHTPNDAACEADFCTTGGTCDAASGCVGGAPRDCSDGDPCTADSCDSSAAACVNTLRDDDGDGASAARVTIPGMIVSCGGSDCDDSDPNVHPGATEVCDGTDNDCDGMTDEGCAPAPDDCATAQALALTGAGSVTVEGQIERFTDNYQTNTICGAQPGGRDAVYSLEIPSGTWDVTIDTIGSAIDTVLGVGVGNSCGSSVLRQICNDDYNNPSGRGNTASRVWVHRVSSPTIGARTRLYILVDTYDDRATSGRFQLNVTLEDAHADRCPTSGSTPLDISGGGAVLGFQTNFTGGHRASCERNFDPEAVFFLRGPTSGRVSFRAYSNDFVPDIYLRAGGCSGGSELACDNGTHVGGGTYRASIAGSIAPGNPYYFFVDGGRTDYVLFFEPY